MTRPLLPALLALVVAMPLTLCVGTGCVAPRTAEAQQLEFERYRLDNGLTVILHEDHRLPEVAVNIWYRVGSKDEVAGRSGFAHLFEHLMFMGTDTVPYPRFDSSMERFGGSNNASTSSDRTNYFERGPRELLETFLFLEADRMAHLGASMTRRKLDAQREVVRNERRQSYENRPYGALQLRAPELLYPRGHPYHEPVIGSHEDLQAAGVEDVKEFFAQFYFPANASLVIAGDFEPARARGWVETYFGPLKSGPAPPRAAAREPRLRGTTSETIPDDVHLPLLALVWHSPAFYAKGDADMDVISSCLGDGKSSRLWRRLVYETKLAQAVQVHQRSKLLGSEFWITVLLRPESSLDAVEAELDDVLEEFRRDGPTPAEVERARNRIDTMFWHSTESLSSRADLLNQYEFYLGDPGALAQDRARYAAVNTESVQRWAAKVLQPGSRLRLVVVPKEPAP